MKKKFGFIFGKFDQQFFPGKFFSEILGKIFQNFIRNDFSIQIFSHFLDFSKTAIKASFGGQKEVELNFQSIEGNGINEKAHPRVYHQFYALWLLKKFT